MKQPELVSAVVLAGGRSQRLGQDKRRLQLWGADGPTLLEHTLALAGAVCGDVVVVLNDAEAWPGLPARIVPDVLPGAGPLSGIAAGLAAARADYCLVLACDMPGLQAAGLARMLTWPRPYTALVPQMPAGPRNRLAAEPLHAIYQRSCLATAQALLAQGERRVASLLEQVGATLVPAGELGLDPTVLRSVNTNTDLEHFTRRDDAPR